MDITSKRSIEQIIATAAKLAKMENRDHIVKILMSEYSYRINEVEDSYIGIWVVITFSVDIKEYIALSKSFKIDKLTDLVSGFVARVTETYAPAFSCKIAIKLEDNPN